MSTKTETKTWCECDYCGETRYSHHYIKYSDHSGINGKDYDMCSDECYTKHLEYIKEIHLDEDISTIEEWIKEFIVKRY